MVVPAYEADRALTPFLQIEQPERLSRREGFRVFGMGANFAARRGLFEEIGAFDEVLGGGGPLRSSQDFDLAYRAYKAGGVILLRPEVTLRHDGKREGDDWRSLLTAYGVGDGGFYAKHARCGDLYALWLLSRRLVDKSGRFVIKRTLRQPTSEDAYIRGVVRGIRESFRFRVDHDARMYVAR
jgi:hypothetical protein